jgi:hypothetical protein
MEDNTPNSPASIENTVQAEALRLKPGPKPKELVEATYLGIPVGRDKKVIDPEDVEKLAALGCKDIEIANYFGIQYDTLRNNFSERLIKGREELKITLRRAMLNNACKNNSAAVQIFLAKNILGMSDNGQESDDKKPLPWNDE